MTIRRVDQPTITPPRTEATAVPARTEAPVATRPTEASAFGGATKNTAALGTTSARPSDHVAGSIAPGQSTPVAPGPLSLNSKAAQEAINKSLEFINQKLGQSLGRSADAGSAFSPRNVEQDNLGMTHVRLDRTHEGVKVFGEQVISHLDRDGNVSSLTGDAERVPAGLGTAKLEVSEKEARAIAKEAFGDKLDKGITLEKVIYKADDGQYKVGYRAEAQNLMGGAEPKRMNYLIDGQTGQIDSSWNQIGGMHIPENLSTEPAPVTVKASASPELAIADKSTVTSTISIADDISIEKLGVGLDIPHTWKGDLVVTLTSPSGTSAVIHNRTGGSADNVTGDFDLSAFAGESAKGDWTLTVEDKANRDTGTLKTWGLEITGKSKQPPPPPPPTDKNDDSTLYSGKVDIGGTQRPDGTWEMKDETRGKGITVLDAKGSSRPGTGSQPITDNNGVWGEAGDPANQKAAVDAAYGAQATYDMYKEILGRDSIDGKGEALKNHVHIGKNYVNAFWDGNQMSYGDGDGKTASALTTLDIAGHEITHGLTERTAGLIYRNESGGINESMSDIMGTMVEWHQAQKNGSVKFDWAVGEDCWTPTNGDPTDALRYMDDPTKDKYSVDNYKNYPKQTEVHGSSGIMNNAFYLLAQGGTNRTSGIEVKDAIGPADAAKVYGRALMFYMTPSTTFAQAREATVQAATDLFGADSAQVAKVRESWTAVGVN
ncbi:MAG: M4 family metallopeptidase [Myxococcota bacterium]|nr:M4 family metallopeptidase [Myxococcota bacterium]